VISRRRCDPRYIQLIPATVDANINAASVFGNKYMAFSSPKNPVFQHISSNDMIDVSSVTTEFNTLFEDGVSISDKVDPVKLGPERTEPGKRLTHRGLRGQRGPDLASFTAQPAPRQHEWPQLIRPPHPSRQFGGVLDGKAPVDWRPICTCDTNLYRTMSQVRSWSKPTASRDAGGRRASRPRWTRLRLSRPATWDYG
jgi:hypothetical protein